MLFLLSIHCMTLRPIDVQTKRFVNDFIMTRINVFNIKIEIDRNMNREFICLPLNFLRESFARFPVPENIPSTYQYR